MARRIKKCITKPITVGVHPSMYSKMEELRKMYQQQTGMNLSQIQVTNILSKSIKIPNKINILGERNAKNKKG